VLATWVYSDIASTPARTGTMKAIVQDEYGEAQNVLSLAEIDRPRIGDDVLLRVHAAGVDRGVWHIMAGLPYPIRLVGYGFRAPMTRVRGREVAGRVEAVGKNRTYPLSETPTAVRHMVEGRVRGKVVITP
jgi:NADPH:quinone reductase-like Zn-dependent oxidoreductase